MQTLRRLFTRKQRDTSGTPAYVSRAGRDCAQANSEDDLQKALRIVSKYSDEKRFSQALVELTDVASSSLNKTELIYARGSVLLLWGRYWEARRLFLMLSQSGDRRAELLVRLGWTYLAHGDYESAETYLRSAVAAKPANWEAHYGLGEVLRNKDISAAKQAFAYALSVSPNNVNCLINLSACAATMKDVFAAEEHARRAIDLRSASVAAWTNLGVALLLQDRLVEAGEAFAQSDQLAGAVGDCEIDDLSLGAVLQLQGQARNAIEYFERMLPRHPNVAASGHYALALLTVGRFTEGWAQYEFRWFDPQLRSQRASGGVPVWNGQEISGKTVLLRCEQGVGDVIQFIRYAPLVKLRGATVWLELRPGIDELADEFPGVDRIFAPGTAIPPHDFFIDLLTLPKAFNTTPSTIPAEVPYLRVPADHSAHWRARLGDPTDLRIGLVWAGDPNHVRDRHRSIPLAKFSSLIAVPGIRWFSLQKGQAAISLSEMESGSHLIDLNSELGSYADTAAVIEELDLIITVDTSVAHLAGALGRPVWVLLAEPADWRWMETREDSPWYPTMRLFRQRKPGDWTEVIGRVTKELTRLVQSGERFEVEVNLKSPDLSGLESCDEAMSPASIVGIPKTCRTRFGIVQYIDGAEPLVKCLAYYGDDLPPRTEILKRLVHPGAFVLELGAGIGFDTIVLASMVAPAGNLLVFENSSVLRQMLRQNLTANGMKCVEVMECVIRGGAGVATASARPLAAQLSALECTVDDLQLEQLDLLKVGDCGLIESVFDGGAATIWRHRPALFLEQDSMEVLTINAARAKDFGYRCWSVETPLFSPSNFNRRTDDIFAGGTALAMLALPEELERDIVISDMRGIHQRLLI
jgi:tetratricopeptide (TPR) repeat protein